MFNDKFIIFYNIKLQFFITSCKYVYKICLSCNLIMFPFTFNSYDAFTFTIRYNLLII